MNGNCSRCSGFRKDERPLAKRFNFDACKSAALRPPQLVDVHRGPHRDGSCPLGML